MTAPLAEAPTGRLVRAMVGRDLADFYPPRASHARRARRSAVRDGANRQLHGVRSRASRRRDRRRGRARRLGQERAGARAHRRRAVRERGDGDRRPRARSRDIRARRSRPASGACRTTESARGCFMQQSVRDNADADREGLRRPLRSPTAEPMSPQATDKRLIQLDVRAASFDQEVAVSVRRQPAAGDHRALAGARSPRSSSSANRPAASTSRRRPRSTRSCATWRGSRARDPDDLVRPARNRRRQRPDPRHARRALVGELPGGATEEEVMAIAVAHDREAARDGFMSDRQAVAPAPAWRRGSAAPLLLLRRVDRSSMSASRSGPGKPECSRPTASSACFSAWSRSASSRSARLSRSSPGRSIFRSPT